MPYVLLALFLIVVIALLFWLLRDPNAAPRTASAGSAGSTDSNADPRQGYGQGDQPQQGGYPQQGFQPQQGGYPQQEYPQQGYQPEQEYPQQGYPQQPQVDPHGYPTQQPYDYQGQPQQGFAEPGGYDGHQYQQQAQPAYQEQQYEPYQQPYQQQDQPAFQQPQYNQQSQQGQYDQTAYQQQPASTHPGEDAPTADPNAPYDQMSPSPAEHGVAGDGSTQVFPLQTADPQSGRQDSGSGTGWHADDPAQHAPSPGLAQQDQQDQHSTGWVGGGTTTEYPQGGEQPTYSSDPTPQGASGPQGAFSRTGSTSIGSGAGTEAGAGIESGATDHHTAPAGEGAGAPEGFTIKANTDTGTFHTPGSTSYHTTRAQVWFADEQSARAAGFRAEDEQQ